MSRVEALLKRDRVLLVVSVALLFVLASLYTALGVGMDMTALQMTQMRGMSDMPAARAPGDWSTAHALLVFLMWWVMMVAMILPSVAPTVLLYSALLRHGGRNGNVSSTATLFLAGYLAAWAGFSVAAAFAQWSLEASGLVSVGMMTLIDSLPGAVVLIASGVFQFTRLKAACLRHCRSPAEFIARNRRPGSRGAVVMGLDHGTYCLGCCWFLMALLFVGGIMNLYWIVGLAAFVALEKLATFGNSLSRIAGVGLIGWGLVIATQAV